MHLLEKIYNKALSTTSLVVCFLSLIINACSLPQELDPHRDTNGSKTRIEQDWNSDHINQRTNEIEKDLNRKHALYSFLEGTYEGILNTDRGSFQVRLILIPSISKIKTERSRTQDELIHDINALSMNTQILQWRPDSPESAIGCMISQIRPDFNRLSIAIASETCPSLYNFNFSIVNEDLNPLNSEDIITYIESDKKVEIREITGTIKPTTNARIYPLKLKKITNNNQKN
jgi:hypothetical protein